MCENGGRNVFIYGRAGITGEVAVYDQWVKLEKHFTLKVKLGSRKDAKPTKRYAGRFLKGSLKSLRYSSLRVTSYFKKWKSNRIESRHPIAYTSGFTQLNFNSIHNYI